MLGSDRQKNKQNKKEMLRITDLRQTKDGRYITAPNHKCPLLFVGEIFLYLIGSFHEECSHLGHLRLAANRYSQVLGKLRSDSFIIVFTNNRC